MTQVTCPGVPAEWINGWLAAVGATVLDPRIRLHWTTDGAPLAVLSAAEIDPVDALVESWPDITLLSDLPIAENWKGAGKVQRKVPVKAFVERTRAARGHRYSWTLSSTMTDLCVDKNGEVAHAPFDPAGRMWGAGYGCRRGLRPGLKMVERRNFQPVYVRFPGCRRGLRPGLG